MDRRLQPIRRNALLVLAFALVFCGPWLGYWTLIPLAIAAVLFRLADRQIDKSPRPEYWVFSAWVGSQIMIASAVVLTGAPEVPAMSWFAIPVVTLSARFSTRGVTVGVGLTLLLLTAVAFGSDAAAVIADPTLLVAPLALVIAVAILSTALMRSDMQHRTEAVVDPLTGMLNRKALENRVDELRQQAAVSKAPVGVIVTDIDHFKRVNDTVGHAVGDAVLRDVAYLIRKDLRAFELAYRIGGEEFLILLPGATCEQSVTLAERIRQSIGDAPFVNGLQMTVSCGVACAPAGEEFDFDGLFARADDALYEAKRQGRDQVVNGINKKSDRDRDRDPDPEPALA